MPQYVQPELQEVQRLHAESATTYEAAERSNQLSDTYVLLTVLFAAVLFFGGISGSFLQTLDRANPRKSARVGTLAVKPEFSVKLAKKYYL